ncbi:MAG: GIY-YIG nuclease family protein [Patescibacteria group bacterium]|jgi:putative endonuclease
MFYVYTIYNSIRDKIYIGQTANLDERLKRHNKILKNKSTSFTNKNSGNWKLIYKEEFKTRQEAIKREKELKSFQGRKFIKNLIKK